MANSRPFRLVNLEPGQYADDLTLELIVGSLTGQGPKKTSYQALSYVWGPKENAQWAYVRTEEGLKRLPITQNLATALRQLRRDDISVAMWIDSICINQDDTHERNKQVSMMADIYRLADRVTVWLGPEEGDSALAFQLLRQLGDGVVEIQWNKQQVVYKNNFNLQSISIDERSARAISRLAWRPWFERLWVLQEIYLAKEALICCGQETMSWEVFKHGFAVACEDMVHAAIERILGSDLEEYQARRMRILRLIMGAKPHFAYLRNFLGSVKCTDDRDRIFGMLSFLELGALPQHFRPNYFLSTREVYTLAVSSHIKHVKSLDILSNCEMRDPNPSEDLPSWVPDFRFPLMTTETSISVSFASSFLPPRFSFKEDILQVDAVRVAIVTAMKSLSSIPISKEGFEILIRETWQFATQNSEFLSSNKDPVSSFCSTLCGGNFKHSFIPERSVDAPFGDCRETMHSMLESRASTNPGNLVSWMTYLTTAKNICQSRGFVVTDQGYIGLAPLSTQAGDEIFVILGCDRPLVLRPRQNQLYQVVGEAILPEIQAGEAVLGPLPEGVRLVNYYFASKNYWYAGFWDERMQQMLKKDPRANHDNVWGPLLAPRYEMLTKEGVDFGAISIV